MHRLVHRWLRHSWPVCDRLLTTQHFIDVKSDKTRSSATAEIARVGGHYTVQGHSRSLQYQSCYLVNIQGGPKMAQFFVRLITSSNFNRFSNETHINFVIISMPHGYVHNERTVPIIMAGCIAHARNGRISTSGVKSDVTIVFLDPDFL